MQRYREEEAKKVYRRWGFAGEFGREILEKKRLSQREREREMCFSVRETEWWLGREETTRQRFKRTALEEGIQVGPALNINNLIYIFLVVFWLYFHCPLASCYH